MTDSADLYARGAAIIEERRSRYRRVDDVSAEMLVEEHTAQLHKLTGIFEERLRLERAGRSEILRTIAAEHRGQLADLAAEKDAKIAELETEIEELLSALKESEQGIC
jgi:hypothetical protein